MNKYDFGKKYSIEIFMSIVSAIFVNIFIIRGKNIDALVLDYRDILFDANVRDRIIIVAYNRVKQMMFYMVFLYFLDISYIKFALSCCAGVLCGVFVSVNIYYSGICNTVMLTIYIIPHFIIYYLGHLYMCNTKKVDKYFYKKIHVWVCLIGILVAGILCECVFSEIFLKFFLQYIVTKK